MALEAADDAKKALCSVAEVGFLESDAHAEKAYELPDGTLVRLSRARQLVPELLFRPETVEQFRSVVARHQVTTAVHQLSNATPHSPLQRLQPPIRNEAGEVVSLSPQPYPLQSALRWSLGMCAPEVRRDLCGHVLLTGGGSCMPGLAQRLKWETLAAVPAAFKPRLLVPAPIERQFGSWIGGSIMSSVSS
jgi:actin-related protein